jgi:NADPH2:quinone reductase
MKGVVVNQESEAKTLLWNEIAEPVAGPEQIVIQVQCAGVNRADLLQRAGKYPPPQGASPILGLEVSGTVAEVGGDGGEWRVGDRVCALLSGGGYAERVVAHRGHVLPVPSTMSWSDAAAIPEAFLTAFTNLCHEAGMRKEDRILIHGGSSGVGTASIQMARAVGALVACTVGNSKKAARCQELGATCVALYKEEDFGEVIGDWAGGSGLDIILDCIGAEYFARNLKLLAINGRLVQIATMSGASAEIDLALLMRKRARVIGSVLRGRSDFEKGELVREFRARFWPLVESGQLVPVVDSVFRSDEIEKAHEKMRGSEHIGKIIIDLSL